jgi:phosphohistidine phosphatase
MIMRLVLVRHAKAEHGGYDDDFSRELTGQGEQNAETVSNFLKSLEIIPDLIITSPATRANQTARIFAACFEYPEVRIKNDFKLYHGYTIAEFLNLLREIPDKNKVVFVFGHNPSIEIYAKNLCKYFNDDVPTCASIVLDFPCDSWEQLENRSAKLFKQVNPKDLGH